jgi:hypothetical protein
MKHEHDSRRRQAMGFQETSEADPARRVFVSYIDKSREYYLSQGFGNPYRWAYNRETPFTRPGKPLSECRVGIVTTSSLWEGQEHVDLVDRPPKRSYACACEPLPERMFTMDLSWDKEATHTDDLGSFLPVAALQELALDGRVGSLSKRFYGVPTEYSQRKTNTVDAPAILEFCREDGVDAVVLVGL